MSNTPEALQKLLRSLQQVPYLASKNLYKVANYFLEQDEDKIAQFCKSILDAKQKIKHCKKCFTWQQVSLPCVFCENTKRDSSVICVVEKWPDVLSVERTSNFNGHYHVLGGVISPLNGVSPENLTINYLIERIADEKPKELVLALSQTPEGEATVAYIVDKLHGTKTKISGLAQGVPVGSSLEYMDRVTLSKALTNRKQLL